MNVVLWVFLVIAFSVLIAAIYTLVRFVDQET